ncbi:MAG: hypothetical protein HQL95_03660 [Magnetococcales bacterium]|nr:hypothetical protein [Magnetococcales bacterium]
MNIGTLLRRMLQSVTFYLVMLVASIHLYVNLGVLHPLEKYLKSIKETTVANERSLITTQNTLDGLSKIDTNSRQVFQEKIFKKSVEKLFTDRNIQPTSDKKKAKSESGYVFFDWNETKTSKENNRTTATPAQLVQGTLSLTTTFPTASQIMMQLEGMGVLVKNWSLKPSESTEYFLLFEVAFLANSNKTYDTFYENLVNPKRNSVQNLQLVPYQSINMITSPFFRPQDRAMSSRLNAFPGCEHYSGILVDMIMSEEEIFIKKMGAIKLGEEIKYIKINDKGETIQRKLARIDIVNQQIMTTDTIGNKNYGCSTLSVRNR